MTSSDPSLRSALTAFGGYVLITSRFVCDSCSFHHDSSVKLVLAYQTLTHSLKQTALFVGMAVIAANLWNVFTRIGDNGMHHEAVTTRPLLQSCIARLSHHARRGIVTIYTAMSEKARKIYRAISEFLSNVSSASQLGIEERRQRIIAHAFREYGIIRRLFPPDIGGQMTIPLA